MTPLLYDSFFVDRVFYCSFNIIIWVMNLWCLWSWGESLGFSNMKLSNIIIYFCHIMLHVRYNPLDQGLISSFKVQCKKKLLKWVLSQFDSSTHHDLRNIMTNVRQAIIWCSQVWREMNPQILQNKYKMFKILLAD